MLYYSQKLPLPSAQLFSSDELVADMLEEEVEGQPRGVEAIIAEQEDLSTDELDEHRAEQEQPTL